MNLVLNSIKPHETDPTLLSCKFIILDFELSRNNVIVTEEVAMETLAPSIKNKPIRGYYIDDDEDFGGHEYHAKEDKYGNTVFERDTIPMGVFISEGYVEEIELNGELKRVLVADAVMWHSQFKKPIDLLVSWFNDNITISMSCEYVYHNYEMVDGIEYHRSPIYLESHCILGKDIVPAYESAQLINQNQLNEFKQLVAQAINQNNSKEDEVLAEEIKNEELEQEVVEESQVEESTEDTAEETQEETKTGASNRQMNEISHDNIRDEIRSQVRSKLSEEEYLWVTEVFETYAILYVQYADSEGYLKYNYTIENNVVTVDIDSEEKVKEKREWVTVTNELEEKLAQVQSEKDELANKFNEATETILSLNATIEELKPLQEQMLNAQREQKLNELTEKFSKAFTNAKAEDKFKSEEVQVLLNEAIDSTDALLKLNEMVVDLVTQVKTETIIEDSILVGLNSQRKNLVEDTVDEFDKLFKL